MVEITLAGLVLVNLEKHFEEKISPTVHYHLVV